MGHAVELGPMVGYETIQLIGPTIHIRTSASIGYVSSKGIHCQCRIGYLHGEKQNGYVKHTDELEWCRAAYILAMSPRYR